MACLPLPALPESQGASLAQDRTLLVTEYCDVSHVCTEWMGWHCMGGCPAGQVATSRACSTLLRSLPGVQGGNLTRNLMAARVSWYRRGKKVTRQLAQPGDSGACPKWEHVVMGEPCLPAPADCA